MLFMSLGFLVCSYKDKKYNISHFYLPLSSHAGLPNVAGGNKCTVILMPGSFGTLALLCHTENDFNL